MIVTFWNVRGCNEPIKHKGLMDFARSSNSDIIAVLETKLNSKMLSGLTKSTFRHWGFVHNFESHHGKRILILWNPMNVSVSMVFHDAQMIYCRITCFITAISFYATFVYAYNSIVDR